MKAIEFPEQNTTFAKNQPEYSELPAFKDPNGYVVACFELNDEEIKQLTESKQIWLSVATFHRPLQPLFLSTKKTDVIVTL